MHAKYGNLCRNATCSMVSASFSAHRKNSGMSRQRSFSTQTGKSSRYTSSSCCSEAPAARQVRSALRRCCRGWKPLRVQRGSPPVNSPPPLFGNEGTRARLGRDDYQAVLVSKRAQEGLQILWRHQAIPIRVEQPPGLLKVCKLVFLQRRERHRFLCAGCRPALCAG
jgi:hypothetical protein